jgi:acyl-CoA synthetase (AMP-forming)/AMP-acid ligase II
VTALSLEQAAATDGERTAIVGADRTLTYRELFVRVERARGWLAAQGIAPAGPEPVALVMQSDLTTVELFWALLGLGRTVLVLHPRQRSEVQAGLIGRTRAIKLDAASYAAANGILGAPGPAGPLEPRLIVPTSGTRGEPKLVCLSQRALIAR